MHDHDCKLDKNPFHTKSLAFPLASEYFAKKFSSCNESKRNHHQFLLSKCVKIAWLNVPGKIALSLFHTPYTPAASSTLNRSGTGRFTRPSVYEVRVALRL